MKRFWVLLVLGLAVVLVACQGDPATQADQGRVLITVGVDAGAVPADGLTSLGVPTDAAGASGVTVAFLRVYSNGDEVFFDENGLQLSGSTGAVSIDLLSTAGTRTLGIFPGTYTFDVTATDGPNELAVGRLENQYISEAGSFRIDLVSNLDSLTLSAPVEVLPNQIFDVYLTVHPPGRTDLRVPTTDYDAWYTTDDATINYRSDLGVRFTAACQNITLTTGVYGEGWVDYPDTPVLANTTTISMGSVCSGIPGVIDIDLIPPFVEFTTPLDGTTVEYWDEYVTFAGNVNDAQSGIQSVTLYEGVQLIGTAIIRPGANPGDYSTWELTNWWTRRTGPHTIMALARDNAGNETAATITINSVDSTP